MKKALVALLLLSVSGFASDSKKTHELRDATLVGYTDAGGTFLAGGQTPASSVLIPDHNFTIVIAIGDIAYSGAMGGHYLPKDVIVGDPIKAFADGKYLYFILPGKKEMKARITQRARYRPSN